MIVGQEIIRLMLWSAAALRLKGAHKTGSLRFPLEIVTFRDF